MAKGVNFERRIMAVKELADYLGTHPSTVYRLLKNDPTFPAYKLGSDWRFNIEDIDKWRANASASRAQMATK